MKRIYLDNNATTALDPRVLEAMLVDLSDVPANPSSAHFFGQAARGKLSHARETIARFFKMRPQEVIFTSGGTESINMLIRGLFGTRYEGHIISSDVEHSCVFHTLQSCEAKGCRVDYLPAGKWGVAKPEAVAAAIRPDTRLIVLGAVNNETGVKIDMEAIAAIAKQKGIPFAVDGVALLGKESFVIPEGVSAMGFAAHKIHGPKGVGLALIRSHLKLTPLLMGGDQEFSKRAGTENLAGILGLAKAIELLSQELPTASARMLQLRERLEQGLRHKLKEILINGEGPRTTNTANISFPGVDGEALLMNLDLAGIAVSHGSACSSGALQPSRVLENMGLPRALASSAIRFSLSRSTTEAEIDACIRITSDIVSRLHSIS